jgi:hypothetical protein
MQIGDQISQFAMTCRLIDLNCEESLPHPSSIRSLFFLRQVEFFPEVIPSLKFIPTQFRAGHYHDQFSFMFHGGSELNGE